MGEVHISLSVFQMNKTFLLRCHSHNTLLRPPQPPGAPGGEAAEKRNGLPHTRSGMLLPPAVFHKSVAGHRGLKICHSGLTPRLPLTPCRQHCLNVTGLKIQFLSFKKCYSAFIPFFIEINLLSFTEVCAKPQLKKKTTINPLLKKSLSIRGAE